MFSNVVVFRRDCNFKKTTFAFFGPVFSPVLTICVSKGNPKTYFYGVFSYEISRYTLSEHFWLLIII